MKKPYDYTKIDAKAFEILDAQRVRKTCQCCGRVHEGVPAGARFSTDPHFGGYYFECQCRSTLFIPVQGAA